MVSTIANKRIQFSLVLLLGLTVSVLTSCGIIQGDPNQHSFVTPASADVRAGDTLQFIVQRNVSVQWSVNGIAGGNATVGIISTSGLYTAPAVLPSPASIEVTATNLTDQSSGDAAVTLQNPIPVLQNAQPDPVTVGAISLTVNGSKFVKGAQVFWNKTALTTTFVSTTRLTATGTAVSTDIGKVQITVKNPDPGAVASSTAYALTVNAPLAVQVKVTPATAQIRVSAKQQF